MGQSSLKVLARTCSMPAALSVPLLSRSLLLASCGGGGGGGNSPSAMGTCGVAVNASGYPHASEPIGTVRQIYDGVLSPDLAVTTYRNIDRLFPTRLIDPGGIYALEPMPLAASSPEA